MSNYSIKIALDTQILAYLIDSTFPSLNDFISELTESPQIELICSRFVTYEFIGIRKHEHYLRTIHQTSNSKGGIMNFSSALKYKSGWSSPELNYSDTYEVIKDTVEKDLKRINDDFGIEYVDLEIHDNLWKPLNDLILSSKISKEDSLVLLSSLWAQNQTGEKHLVFLTNDNDFFNSCYGRTRMESIDQVFKENDLEIPYSHKIDAIQLKNYKAINLTETNTLEEINSFVKSFILENLKTKYKSSYLGKVVPVSAKMAGKLLCFELADNNLLQNIYLSIIPSDGIPYNHDTRLSNFYNVNVGKITNYPYIPDEQENSKIISVMLQDEQGHFLNPDLYNKITTPGSLVFVHLDSDID